MKRYEFNGQQLTRAEIALLVPALKPKTLIEHIKAGRNTTEAILCHVPAKPKPGAKSQFVISPKRGYARTAPSNMR